MYKLFLVFCGLLLYLPSWSQRPNISFLHQADSLSQKKEYSKAAHFYAQYTQVAEYTGVLKLAYYNAACSYALANNQENAFKYLQLAIQNGWSSKEQTKTDSNLNLLHQDPRWTKILATIQEPVAFRTNPNQVKLVTTDISNYWRAYDLAQKDTAHQYQIFKKEYIDRGSKGLQDYFALKVGSIQNFVDGQNARQKFYKAIRTNTLKVNQQKELILQAFVSLKRYIHRQVFRTCILLSAILLRGYRIGKRVINWLRPER